MDAAPPLHELCELHALILTEKVLYLRTGAVDDEAELPEEKLLSRVNALAVKIHHFADGALLRIRESQARRELAQGLFLEHLVVFPDIAGRAAFHAGVEEHLGPPAVDLAYEMRAGEPVKVAVDVEAVGHRPREETQRQGERQ